MSIFTPCNTLNGGHYPKWAHLGFALCRPLACRPRALPYTYFTGTVEKHDGGWKATMGISFCYIRNALLHPFVFLTCQRGIVWGLFRWWNISKSHARQYEPQYVTEPLYLGCFAEIALFCRCTLKNYNVSGTVAANDEYI